MLKELFASETMVAILTVLFANPKKRFYLRQLVGLTMGLQALYTLMVNIISPRWRRTHCPFCKTSEEVQDILSPHDAFD